MSDKYILLTKNNMQEWFFPLVGKEIECSDDAYFEFVIVDVLEAICPLSKNRFGDLYFIQTKCSEFKFARIIKEKYDEYLEEYLAGAK